MSLILASFVITCVTCYGLFHLLIWHMKRRRMRELASKLKGPPGFPILGNALMLVGNSEHLLNKLNEWNELYSSPCRFWVGTQLAIMVNDAEQIKKILLDYEIAVEKGEFFGSLGESFVGTGLVTAPDTKALAVPANFKCLIGLVASTWRVHRKLIQPTFNQRILTSFVEIFVTQSKIFTEIIQRKVDGPEFDVFKLVSLCTLDIICETAMGVKIEAQRSKNNLYLEALHQVMESFCARFFNFWLRPNFIFYRTKLGIDQRRNLKYLHGFSKNVIKMKRDEISKSKNQLATSDNEDDPSGLPPGKNAFLDHLIKLTEEAGNLSDTELREQVDTLIVAGHDTTAITIAYMMLMLASNPDIQDKVYQELYDIYGGADSDERPVTPEDLMHMKYLERVIKETTRLFPPIPYIVRYATKELNIGEHILPKGSNIVIGIQSLHRREEYWPNPLVFDPDRFLPEENVKRHPFAFMAFSSGPRNCIGIKFSMMSMKTIMATVLRRYILKKDNSVPIKDIRLSMEITIKPVEPITLRIERRTTN